MKTVDRQSKRKRIDPEIVLFRSRSASACFDFASVIFSCGRFYLMHEDTLMHTAIGVGAQSTLGGHKIFARKICIKNQQNA